MATDDRTECTADNPWVEGDGRAFHPDSKEINYSEHGDGQSRKQFECPNCHLKFWVDQPDY